MFCNAYMCQQKCLQKIDPEDLAPFLCTKQKKPLLNVTHISLYACFISAITGHSFIKLELWDGGIYFKTCWLKFALVHICRI
jgi:hypothetical protein